MDFKNVLVVGGSSDYVGAPYLAAIAALRAGAGSVVVMSPEKVAWAINALSPDLMTKKLSGEYLGPEHQEAIEKMLETADILLIGNGLGRRPETAELVRNLVEWPGQKVIDADALKALNTSVENAILTPNAREWKLMEANLDVAHLLEKNIIVKKGAETSILTKERQKTVPVNPGLERAGMGDVLAGLCAGSLSQGLPAFDAAEKACAVGNDAAEILTEKKQGYYFLASDILEEIEKIKKNS
jgi:hydroxyethylthiazole kinase-like uncharacterized protein yjeF